MEKDKKAASQAETLQAVLYSKERPNPSRWEEMLSFLRERYGDNVSLEWSEDSSILGGFRLEVGADVYKWDVAERLRQLKEKWTEAVRGGHGDVIPLLRDTLQDWTPKALAEQTGEVLTIGDGIATISGLNEASYGEILLFSSGVRGMVQELRKDYIGCILFGSDQYVAAGSEVKRTGREAGVPVGEGFLGRVVNALGQPLDGKGPIEAQNYLPMESPAPGIIDRQPVNTPLETGLIAIDSMFQIGRGQRELIIGDRQTGKTAIALDTILNQKGKDVICIYVAIGQKASSVAQLAETLRRHDAMEYSIIVAATASEPAPLQYIAPYAGCTLGEYFMNQGRDVLIVYDDLSKHAVAYRAMSLLLERSPGREAYPGDVFYLHSRLLERSAHLSAAKGGGSLTALPIVETQAGDVSSYIPTNIISITDGQIFLESDLFFAGQRPAVNVGLSVSRVGGDAQTKAMKSAAGTLRLELAQYREMEVFTQFSSDLDDVTRRQLAHGAGLMALLRQEQYKPFSQHRQVILLVAALGHCLQSVPVSEISACTTALAAYVETHEPALCREIEQTGQLTASMRQRIESAARAFVETGKW